ncbi:MAG: ATPase [Gammaproteobacteria bacterium]|nr:ATPase [Gammaproteobacteria bacterium]
MIPTRMLFLGDAPLADGFNLIGFETWADPDSGQLQRVINELLTSRTNAFVILDHTLATAHSKLLAQVRNQGGRIVITVVPPLNAPDLFQSQIDQQVNNMLNSELVEKQA